MDIKYPPSKESFVNINNVGNIDCIRPSKKQYYLNIARVVATRSTCLRRRYGAVIVKNDCIISTGYNGSSVGESNCCDVGYCERESKNIPQGSNYELCKSVHAEANAIMQAGKNAEGATLYLACLDEDKAKPCMMCERLIKNAKIKEVIS